LAKGNASEAVEDLKQAVMLDPRDLKARTVLVLAERLNGDLSSASSRIDQVATELPIDYFTLNEQYRVNKAIGNESKAKAAWDQLQHLLSREPDSVLELAFDYLAVGQRSEAMQVLENAIKSGPSGNLTIDKTRIDPMLYYTLGYVYEKNGDR